MFENPLANLYMVFMTVIASWRGIKQQKDLPSCCCCPCECRRKYPGWANTRGRVAKGKKQRSNGLESKGREMQLIDL